ncbi:MAG TPA: DUF5050 domain-containing protein [Candidatus Sulfotelmatobacter sp.]|nr:DUF5050 domain-containing protein [Candidatus Sulfotelmatobacter sp.]
MVRLIRSFLLLTVCGSLLLLSGCSSSGSQSKQPPPPTNVLAYLHRTGIPGNYVTYDLKVMRSDGTTGTVLSSQSLLSAVLSPDGQKILYSYYDPNVIGYQVATINPDGTQQKVLTAPGSFQLYPKYTPDGSKIVFEASGNLARSIGVMNADGSNPQIINAAVGNQYCFPATNGSIIAVSEIVGAMQGLATMNLDGSNQQLLVYSQYFAYPSFSADGNTIFFSDSDGRNLNVYSIASSGSMPHELTNSTLNWDPVVTNNKIYFVSVPSSVQNPTTDSQQIFSINADGSNLTQVTNDTLYDGFQTANGVCLNP